jgi:hypothetical protein
MADLVNDLGERCRPRSIIVALWKRLRDEGRPASDPEGLALSVASDGADARVIVELDIDPVEHGALAEAARRRPPRLARLQRATTAAAGRERLDAMA